jgi:hypothetical protein
MMMMMMMMMMIIIIIIMIIITVEYSTVRKSIINTLHFIVFTR